MCQDSEKRKKMCQEFLLRVQDYACSLSSIFHIQKVSGTKKKSPLPAPTQESTSTPDLRVCVCVSLGLNEPHDKHRIVLNASYKHNDKAIVFS